MYLRGLTLGMQVVSAHPAVAAGDVERNYDPVADAQLGDLRSDGLDDAHRLVPEHIARVQERCKHGVEMQI